MGSRLVGSSNRQLRRSRTAARDGSRALFEHGVALAAAHAWQDAAARFRASLALEPRASTYFNLAVTLYRLELHAELVSVATRYLELRDPTRSEADRTEIARLRSEAIGRVARIHIEVSPAEAEVLVDGAALTASMLADDLVLDPGNHSVLARANGTSSTAHARCPRWRAHELTPGADTASASPQASAQPSSAAFTQRTRETSGTPTAIPSGLAMVWIGAGVVVARPATVGVC